MSVTVTDFRRQIAGLTPRVARLALDADLYGPSVDGVDMNPLPDGRIDFTR